MAGPGQGHDKCARSHRYDDLLSVFLLHDDGMTPFIRHFDFSRLIIRKKEEMERGIARMAQVIRASWKLEQ